MKEYNGNTQSDFLKRLRNYLAVRFRYLIDFKKVFDEVYHDKKIISYKQQKSIIEMLCC